MAEIMSSARRTLYRCMLFQVLDRLKWKKGAFQRVHQALMPLDNVDDISDIVNPTMK